MLGGVLGDQNGRNENGGQDPGWFGEKKGRYANGQQANGGMNYHVQSEETAQWDGTKWVTTGANRRITGTGTTSGPAPTPLPQQ
jgi:hypothetical protein